MRTSYLDDVKQPLNFNPVSPPFDLLVQDLFHKITSVSPHTLDTSRFINVTNYKQHVFEAFISYWKIQFGNDIYAAIRLILPNRDSRLYNMKDLKLNHLIIKLLNIPKDSDHYNQLLNWKKHYHNYKPINDESADLPLLISKILTIRRTGQVVKPSLTINDINATLDKLATLSKVEDQLNLLVPVINKLSIAEVRWFFHIILKISVLSVSETHFLRCWHPDAPDLFLVCKDLQKIVWFLTDPAKRLTPENLQPQLFYSFVPQSSKKLEISYENLCKKMIHSFSPSNDRLNKVYDEENFKNSFIVEEKLDGDRMLVHMVNESYPHSYENLQFKTFSRRRRDYTLLYGQSNHFGTLSRYLTNAFGNANLMVKNCILDGEMLAWDCDTETILPFGILRAPNIQESVKQFTTEDPFKAQGSQPLFIMFDILHLNDRDLTQLPLFYRKSILKKIINPIPHRFEVLHYDLASTPNDLKISIKNVISARAEGIMVKSCLSKYYVGIRSTTWIKIKPEYLEFFGENIDVIVIGKVPGVKNAFMCGLIDLNHPDKAVRSFCTVANGFTYDEFSRINSMTYGKWHDFRKNPPPENLLLFGSKKPDFWIDPADSFVLEIKARSIDNISETTYAAGSTLHNLWCRSIRIDKDYTNCETLQSYLVKKQMISKATEKTQAVNRKRRLKNLDVSFNERNKLPKKIAKTSNIFTGVLFVILTDYKNPKTNERTSINDLKLMVKKHGGQFTNDVTKVNLDRFKIVVISETLSPTTQNYYDIGFDVIKPDWIFECIRKDLIAPVEPSMIFKTKNAALMTRLTNRIDEFGDSYVIANHNNYSMHNYLKGLDFHNKRLTKDSFELCQEDFEENIRQLQLPGPLLFLFRNLTFNLVAGSKQWEVEALARRIKRYGGAVSADLHRSSFVVVPNSAAPSGVDQISSKLSDSVSFGAQDTPSKVPYIVTEQFIDAAVEQGQLVDPEDYKYARQRPDNYKCAMQRPDNYKYAGRGSL